VAAPIELYLDQLSRASAHVADRRNRRLEVTAQHSCELVGSALWRTLPKKSKDIHCDCRCHWLDRGPPGDERPPGRDGQTGMSRQ